MILVIGYGSAGKRWAQIAREAGHRVGVYDPNLERHTQALADGAEPYSEAEVTRVILATPPMVRGAVVLPLPRGLPLLVEKPLACTLADADAMAAHADTLHVVCNLRYHPRVALLWQALLGVGEVIAVRFAFGHHYPADYMAATGIHLDGIHELDLARWLVGPVDRAVALRQRPAYAAYLLGHTSGVHSEIHLNWRETRPHRSVTVIGTEGRVTVDLTMGAEGWMDTYRRNFADWIAGKASNGFAEARETLRLALT